MIHVDLLLSNLESSYRTNPELLRRSCAAAWMFFKAAEQDLQQWLHLRSFITPTIPKPQQCCKECKRPL